MTERLYLAPIKSVERPFRAGDLVIVEVGYHQGLTGIVLADEYCARSDSHKAWLNIMSHRGISVHAVIHLERL